MKNKKLKIMLILPILLVLLAGMTAIDYTLSTKAHAPIFAFSLAASDVEIYHGWGYTIIIDDGYAVAPPDAELKGYFYWGWR